MVVRQRNNTETIPSEVCQGSDSKSSGKAYGFSSSASESGSDTPTNSVSDETPRVILGTTTTVTHFAKVATLPSQTGKKYSSPENESPGEYCATSSTSTKIIRKSLFKPRVSRLDSRRMFTSTNGGRGWYVLFWLAMLCYIVRQFAVNFLETGYPIKGSAFPAISEGILELLVADMVVVSYSFTAFGWQKAITGGWIQPPDSMVAYVIQHLNQACLLFGVVVWLLYQEWTWVQTGVLLLHTMVIVMKMHSYSSSNRELAVTYKKLQELLVIHPDAITQSSQQQPGDRSPQDVPIASHTPDDRANVEPVLRTPDEDWNRRATDLMEALSADEVSYPYNVTLVNFVDYLFVPALVYELYYPRIPKIRLGYLVEKICATFGVFALLHVTFEDYIIPILAEIPRLNMVMTILELITPVMICYLLIFYIIFECICNVFAEITRFADRNFYDDWWNSTSFDEYSRKWNKPVHYFLLRHIYFYSIDTYRMSRRSATFLTFFLSSCLHELVLAMVAGRLRMYLFMLQMAQLPLIYLGRMPLFRRFPVLGNGLFWLGMISGPPLLAVLYCRENYLQ
ncbi:Sterol O-acyltransferase 2 (Sterol-ester synthase 2) [Dispira parvispora]|uniref:Sterol O-acyltransferase 2 (Sterol-ester synthase 2) n=1 Tax=Dispira parvispora TaxID=1520584 RepID=A0A9W8AUZ2_9FUNG|nr:Sterol O-acyltransferase 2 (Sterol-ester synthase 2) [Dispira parvispora]